MLAYGYRGKKGPEHPQGNPRRHAGRVWGIVGGAGRKGRETRSTLAEVPADWSGKKKAHKDTDARWAKKNGAAFYGDKNHLNAGRKHKLIRLVLAIYDSALTGPDVILDTKIACRYILALFFGRRILVMNDDTVHLDQTEEDALSYEVSDEALEAAADASTKSYTYQTSAYNRCCR